jgi:hypothetical protein
VVAVLQRLKSQISYVARKAETGWPKSIVDLIDAGEGTQATVWLRPG